MEIENKLKDQGWYLTDVGIKKILNACTNEESKNNIQKLIQIAKDMDFRDIAGGALGKKRDDDLMAGKVVLQLQKIRVISAPKANEESRAAPRLMQLEFTDGQTTVSALEMEYIPALNLDIPPGTKIFFRSENLKVTQGNIELKSSDIQVLGGNVEALVEKWKMQKTMQQYTKMGRPVTGASGPPPWIAFGQKIEANKDIMQNDRNFKSLQSTNERDKDSKEDEFNAMRSEAIANANKASSKKIFGGGGQVLLDHNVKKILEKGYTEEEAKDALRATNNNLERALYSLKRSINPMKAASRDIISGKGPQNSRNAGGRGESSGRRNNSNKDEITSKPAISNVSLFDFLTDKFPAGSESTSNNTKAKNSGPTSTTTVTTNSLPSTSEEKKKQDAQAKSDTFKQNSRSNYNEKPLNQNKKITDSNDNERPKFENNLSSSFAANRYTNNPVDQERREFKSYQNAQNNNSNNANRIENNTPSYNPSGKRGGINNGPAGSSLNNRNSAERNFKGQPTEERKFPPREFRNSRSQQMRQPPNNSHQGNSNPRNLRHSNDNRNYLEDESPSERGNFKKSYSGRNQNSYSQQKQGSEERYNPNTNNRYNQNSQRKTNYQSQTNSNSNSMYSGPSNNSNQSNFINQVTESMNKMRIDSSHQQQQNVNHQPQTQQQIQQQSQQQTQQLLQQQQPPQPQQHQIQQNQNQNHHRNQNRQPQQQAMIIQANQPQTSTQYSNTQKQPQIPADTHFTKPQYLPSPSPPVQQAQIVTSRPAPQTFGRPIQNGLPYDPNESIALNVGQNISMIPNSIHQVVTSVVTSQPPQPAHVYLAAASHSPAPVFAAGPAAPAAYIIPSPPLPQPAQLAPATVIQQAPQAPYGLLPPPPTEGYPWKAGDRCYAKYWDDGRYYDAEVTAVADTTCVVYYLGYGNHEEVLKSDLVPVTDFIPQPHAVKSFTATNLAPAPQAVPPTQQPITFQTAPVHMPQVASVHAPIPVAVTVEERVLTGKKRFKKNIGFQGTYIPPNQRNKNRNNFS